MRRNEIGATRRGMLQGVLGLGAALPGIRGFAAEDGLAQPRATDGTASPLSEGPRPDAVYNVRALGAAGDGKTLDTEVLNRAIEQASAAGGGTVHFPAGSYLCYSIRLKSNVSLYLAPGSTLMAAEPQGGRGYDTPEPNAWEAYQDFGHSHWHNSLIWGEGLTDISIAGPGLAWGKGLTRGPNERGAGVGDKSIALKNCHNVTIRDISILHGGHFGILATGVDNLTLDNLMIDTNRDGMDIDCCRNVRVSNCTVNSPWDDGICPKSSYALGYPRSTENVTITNCYVTGSYQEGSLLDGTWKPFAAGQRIPRTGRIKCGTESNGGFKNITISNCVFEACGGLALETVDGALLEDITVSNVTMRGIVNAPIFMRLGSRLRGPQGTVVGKLRRVSISNLVASNAAGRYACIISGIPGNAIEDVRLTDIYILSQGGGTKEDAALEPPEKESGYPEPTTFGTMPAYGFFIRHTKGLRISDVDLQYDKPDLRPAFVLQDVESADFLHVRAQHAPDVPIFSLKRAADLNVYFSRPLPDTHIERTEQKDLGAER